MAVDHKAEAERYDRLAKEARNQTTSAQTPEYYERMAAKHRKACKTVSESEDSKAEHYKGLAGWVSDYKAQRKAGNVKDATQTRDNIKAAIAKHGLDANKVWGEDPDKPKVAEGRYPSKQTPQMKALAAQAEKDAAAERKTKSKKPPVKENNMAVSGLALLVESELEKAQVVIAAKGILDKLQKMAEDLAKTEADDIMPMLDSMRLTFGPELTDSFNDVATAKIRQTMEAVKGAKEAITREVGRLENQVNGDMTNDIGMGDEPGADMGDMGDEMGDDMDGAPDMGDEMGGDQSAEGPLDMGGDEEATDDLDAAFDDAATDNTAAGRARKESIERNVKALRESANPDRLVFETFRRTLTETKDAVRSASAVARAFAIDFEDVVSIVKEGKTFKDEKGKSNKNKDYQQDRKEKKRERPSDLDESVSEKRFAHIKTAKADATAYCNKLKAEGKDAVIEPDSEGVYYVRVKPTTEGKTFKDEKGKSDRNKDRSQERQTKRRERPSDLDECNDKVEEGELPAFLKSREDAVEKSKKERAAKGLTAQDEAKKKDKKVEEKFDMKPTPASKRDMFNGKTKEELHSMVSSVKKQMKSHEDKGEKVPDALRTKFSELNFALRAKNDWGKTESVEEAAHGVANLVKPKKGAIRPFSKPVAVKKPTSK